MTLLGWWGKIDYGCKVGVGHCTKSDWSILQDLRIGLLLKLPRGLWLRAKSKVLDHFDSRSYSRRSNLFITLRWESLIWVHRWNLPTTSFYILRIISHALCCTTLFNLRTLELHDPIIVPWMISTKHSSRACCTLWCVTHHARLLNLNPFKILKFLFLLFLHGLFGYF